LTSRPTPRYSPVTGFPPDALSARADTDVDMPWQIPLLQRYIFWEISRVFVFIVSCLTVLLVVVGVVQNATDQGLGPQQILEVLPFIVPSMLPFTIPAAMLLTVCVVYGRIAGDQEVTACKAAGISVVSLLWPAFFLGAVLSAASLLLTDQVIPWAIANIQQRIATAMEDVVFDRLRNEHQFRDPKIGIDVTVQDVRGRELIRPVIRYRKNAGRVGTLQAEAAEFHLDLAEQQATLKVRNARIDVPGELTMYINGEGHETIAWRRETEGPKARHMPIQVIEADMQQSVASVTALEERDAVLVAMALTTGDYRLLGEGRTPGIQDLHDERKNILRLTTEIHSRFALACSCFFFTLLGGPFAIFKAKAQFLTSFLYCFVPIVTGYYPLVLTMMVQSKRGQVDPEWAVWLANGVLALIAAYVLRRVLRN
jgi:lipopolysaccharide export system permease protein